MRWSGKGFPGGRNSLQRDGGSNDCLMMETSCTAAKEEIGSRELQKCES